MSPLLEVKNLSVGYGDTAVVREVDLSVECGEIVALFGANGAGKTTMIRGISGLLPRSAGDVYWKGRLAPRNLHRLARQGYSLITEERSVFATLTVEKNLALGRGDLDRAYELFPELVPMRRRRAGLLSGGEQQMLTLARALSRTPDLLVIDELSLGLAPLAVERLLAALRAAADAGLGVLLVEQRIDLAMCVADRFTVLVRGRVALHGDAHDLSTRLDDVRRAYLHAPAS